jgi:cytochrome c oxidase subunit 1
VLWYTLIPRVAGGRLFSDPLTRVVFVMFILFSTPVGLHHQFGDPGIGAGWKLAHTVTTFAILFPSLVTAFTVTASLEDAGRRQGATGLFDWIGRLPWRDPFVASVALAMITFALGGFGGAVNAAYSMNVMVHNTAWVQGHFHLTVGTAVALSFMGYTYWLLPRLTGRALAWRPIAVAQPYAWFVGMQIFSLSSHVAGLRGMPRRVYTGDFLGAEAAEAWNWLTDVSAVGGVVLFASAMAYVAVFLATLVAGEPAAEVAIAYADPIAPVAAPAGIWDRFGLWTAVAVVLIAIAYVGPLVSLYSLERFGSQGFRPF